MSAPYVSPVRFDPSEFLQFPEWSLRKRLIVASIPLSLGFLFQAFILGTTIGTDLDRLQFEGSALLIIFLSLLVLIGNCFFLVRNISNDPGITDDGGKWEAFPADRLETLLEFDQKMVCWDGDPVCSGDGFLLNLIPVGFGLAIYLGWDAASLALVAIGSNGMVIILPHLFTGRRSAHRVKNVIEKGITFRDVLKNSAKLLQEFQTETLLLLVGGDAKIPKDVKLRIRSPKLPPSFLGMEAHISFNEVKSTKYPYFYTVLIARPEFGLHQFKVTIGDKMVAETKTEKGIDVLVIRQATTETSGYHTNKEAALQIFHVGLKNLLQLQSGAD